MPSHHHQGYKTSCLPLVTSLGQLSCYFRNVLQLATGTKWNHRKVEVLDWIYFCLNLSGIKEPTNNKIDASLCKSAATCYLWAIRRALSMTTQIHAGRPITAYKKALHQLTSSTQSAEWQQCWNFNFPDISCELFYHIIFTLTVSGSFKCW